MAYDSDIRFDIIAFSYYLKESNKNKKNHEIVVNTKGDIKNGKDE